MPNHKVVALINACKKELDYFGQGAKKEYEASVYRRVGDYWDRLAQNPAYATWKGYNGRRDVTFGGQGNVIANHNQPWSAAFISFVMSEAGAGADFSYAPSHSVYIVKALDEAQKAHPTAKFIARRHTDYAPKVGDIIACERRDDANPTFDTYKSYVAAKKYEAHCDVVVEIDGNTLKTIGGNVSNSVSQKTWPLNGGKIESHSPNHPEYGVICIIENLL